MAADILAQRADFVLVGDDQKQHLEFTRQAARRWNHAFGLPARGPAPARLKSPVCSAAAISSEVSASFTSRAPEDLFCLPRLLGAKRICARLGDLEFPERKMSKSSVEWSEANSAPVTEGKGSSREGRGCLFLMDSPDAIAEKIAKAKTDTIRGTYRHVQQTVLQSVTPEPPRRSHLKVPRISRQCVWAKDSRTAPPSVLRYSCPCLENTRSLGASAALAISVFRMHFLIQGLRSARASHYDQNSLVFTQLFTV